MTDSAFARNLTSMLENAREFTMNSLNSSGHSNINAAAISDLINNKMSETTTKKLTSSEIVSYLSSSTDKEKLQALKYLMSVMVQSQTLHIANSSDSEMIQYFPHVIKNISSNNVKIKRLVFIYLIRYNHLQPDLALLSINAIQKSLTDKNCILRALAIRVISGIKIQAIIPILLLSNKKTVSDFSPLVRASTAIAITKCFNLDKEFNGHNSNLKLALKDDSSIPFQLYRLLGTLMSDNDPKVLSMAIIAYNTIFKSNIDLIHPRFKHIVSHFTKLDPFAQVIMLDLFTDYCKLYIPPVNSEKIEYHSDLNLILSSVQFSIYSSSNSVLISLIRFLRSCSLPMETLLDKYKLDSVFLRLLQSCQNTNEKQIILEEVLQFASSSKVFKNAQLSQLYPSTEDSNKTIKLKVSILLKSMDSSNFDQVFKELKYFVEVCKIPLESKVFIIKSLNSFCFSNSSNLSEVQRNRLLKWYLSKFNHVSQDLVLTSEYIAGIRFIIQTDLVSNIDILIQMVGKIVQEESTINSVAKATIVWLLGEFSNHLMTNHNDSNKNTTLLAESLPDMLRSLLSKFSSESTLTRLSILLFATKLCSKDLYQWKLSNSNSEYGEIYNFDNPIFKLFNLTLQYCKHDPVVDIRDRSRMIGALLPNILFVDMTLQSNSLTDFDTFLNRTTAYSVDIVSKLEEKLNEIEFSSLIFQVNKKPPTFETSSAVTQVLSSFTVEYNNSISPFNEDMLNQEMIKYYEDLRNETAEIKDYSKNTTSYSGNTIPPSRTSKTMSGIGGNFNSFNSNSSRSPTPPYERQFQQRQTSQQPAFSSNYEARVNAAKKYHLQSLDDFLGNETYNVDTLIAPRGGNAIAQVGKTTSSEEEDSDEEDDEEEEQEDEDTDGSDDEGEENTSNKKPDYESFDENEDELLKKSLLA